MTKNSNIKNNRLGSIDNAEHVAQTVACITLDGVKPSERAITLATLMSNGKMTPEEAIKIVKSWYSH